MGVGEPHPPTRPGTRQKGTTMIHGNKVRHEWMEQYVELLQKMKTASASDIMRIYHKSNAYKYRLIEALGREEFLKQLEDYTKSYERIH